MFRYASYGEREREGGFFFGVFVFVGFFPTEAYSLMKKMYM